MTTGAKRAIIKDMLNIDRADALRPEFHNPRHANSIQPKEQLA